jgi:hypothetical protein
VPRIKFDAHFLACESWGTPIGYGNHAAKVSGPKALSPDIVIVWMGAGIQELFLVSLTRPDGPDWASRAAATWTNSFTGFPII